MSNINEKQEELIKELVAYLKKQFPEIELIGVQESPEDPESLWVRVTAPEDQDRRTALTSRAADKSMDILEDYGYHVLVMPTRRTIEAA